MQVEQVSISEIIPYEFNNRKHPEEQVKRIANSIVEFGFTQPILIDEKNIILAGHGRYMAAKLLSLNDVPCIQRNDLNEAQKRAYRVLDNKLVLDSEWDLENLAVELGLLEHDGYDLEPFGLEELAELFPGSEPPVIEDDIAEPESTYINVGDLIELGEHRVICGDSGDPVLVEKLLDGNQPILMVTDPPYGVNYDAGWRNEQFEGKRAIGKVTNDDQVDWSSTIALYGAQIVYAWHSDKMAAEVALGLIDIDYEIVSQIIWAKQHFAIGRGDYHWMHEPCWYAVKKDKNHNWQGSRKETTLWEIANNNSFGGGGSEEKTNHSTQKTN